MILIKGLKATSHKILGGANHQVVPQNISIENDKRPRLLLSSPQDFFTPISHIFESINNEIVPLEIT